MAHRIHAVYPNGPVGQTGKIQPGDFLIEVNGVNVLDLTHPEVVMLIQGLPTHIRLVVARLVNGYGKILFCGNRYSSARQIFHLNSNHLFNLCFKTPEQRSELMEVPAGIHFSKSTWETPGQCEFCSELT